METPVIFNSAGFQLVGILHRPEPAASRARRPAILFLHGFTGQKAEAHRLFVKTARALAHAGFIALRFDFRGSGDSGGEFEEVAVSGWRQDARAALDVLLRQQGVDASRVGVIGLSMGGAVACHLAAGEPRVRSLALWSAVANGTDVVGVVGSPESLKHLAKHGWTDRMGNKVSAKFVKEFKAMRPSADLKRSRCPVFIAHGAADETVPVAQADQFEAAARATRGRRVEKLIIPFANHTYANLALEARLIKATVVWFQRTL
ncbi:MAG: alpha/beta fold hydrolase [Verrucomicrobia bacterium]|nr:alpha/beta fold hydrolase [Verrucomicrobiota bacterium]